MRIDALEPAFDAMVADGMEAAVINAESLFFRGKKQIAALARKLPTCTYTKEVLEAGTLISYGADQLQIARAVGLLCRSYPQRREAL